MQYYCIYIYQEITILKTARFLFNCSSKLFTYILYAINLHIVLLLKIKQTYTNDIHQISFTQLWQCTPHWF